MAEDWPPPGAHFAYRMDVRLENPELEYATELVVWSNQPTTETASFRYGRLGGLTNEDHDFRDALYRRIGAVTVAGGHAEAAMKRVILVAEAREQAFRDVDLTWTSLVKRLRQVASSDHDLAKPLDRILAWSERRQIKKLRDDVVHAYWWHWAGVGVSRSRFNRDGSTYTIHGRVEDLQEMDRQAALIFEYARRLDDLVVSSWPQARFIP